jgi:hypothetical protein
MTASDVATCDATVSTMRGPSRIWPWRRSRDWLAARQERLVTAHELAKAGITARHDVLRQAAGAL